VILSDEVSLRQAKYPSLGLRVQMEKEFNKIALKALRVQAKEEETKKRWEEKILREAGMLQVDEKGDDDDETKSEKSVEESEGEAEAFGVVLDKDDMTEEEFIKHINEMKEEKFAKQRNPFRFHRQIKTYDRMKLALKLSLGMKGVVRSRHPHRHNRDSTQLRSPR
jgi:hypothetical protein